MRTASAVAYLTGQPGGAASGHRYIWKSVTIPATRRRNSVDRGESIERRVAARVARGAVAAGQAEAEAGGLQIGGCRYGGSYLPIWPEAGRGWRPP